MEIHFAGYVAASWLLEQQPQQWHSLMLLDSGLRPTPFSAGVVTVLLHRRHGRHRKSPLISFLR